MKTHFLTQFSIICIISIFALIANSAEEAEKTRLLIVPLKARGDISRDDAITLTDILSVEIHKSGKFVILNRHDMKAVLTEKEYKAAIMCNDNKCLLKNVDKLDVSKVIAGSIGKLGKKYNTTIRLINKDGQNEIMEKDICECPIEGLDKSIERIASKFLQYFGEAKTGEITSDKKPEPRENAVLTTKLQSTITSAKLRSTYNYLSETDVQDMPNIIISKNDESVFTGYSIIKHKYKAKEIKNDKVIIDRATDLMWHQSGNASSFSWMDAYHWIDELNQKGYAGYQDWRFPTLEEAASLLEPSKKNKYLYISPVFSREEEWIWTGDLRDQETAWIVYFRHGSLVLCGTYSHYMTHGGSIRPVRSLSGK